MSRVFTSPPIVISRNQTSCQNLVESTKLERIKIDSKKALRIEKEHRKQKKETKRERSYKHSRKADDNYLKQEYLSSKRVSDDESDQLEKSGLTEELEEPRNHLGYLSDGSQNSKSQNSKKRKRDNSPPVIESLIKAAPVSGNPLRIRLIFKKPKVEVPLVPQEEIVCSTSAAKSLIHQDVITSSVSCSNISEPEKNQPSTSVAAIVETKRHEKHKPSKEDRYNALFDNWTLTSTCLADVSSSNDNDDEWLFGDKRQDMFNIAAPVKIDEDTKMRTGDSSWPRAKFLSGVRIHSLPYTVLF